MLNIIKYLTMVTNFSYYNDMSNLFINIVKHYTTNLSNLNFIGMKITKFLINWDHESILLMEKDSDYLAL